MLYQPKWAIVVHNGDPEAVEMATQVLATHNLTWEGVMVVANPFSQADEKHGYDEDIVELTIQSVLTVLHRYVIDGNKVFIICSHEWDEDPAGEIAGALTGKADVIFYYADGRMALPDSSTTMTSQEATRVYRYIWGFDVRLSNFLKRKDIYPQQLLVMPIQSIRQIHGLGEKSLATILAARQRILAGNAQPIKTADARNEFTEVWQLAAYPTNMLLRAGLSPQQVVMMTPTEIRRVRGIGDDSLALILEAKERVLSAMD